MKIKRTPTHTLKICQTFEPEKYPLPNLSRLLLSELVYLYVFFSENISGQPEVFRAEASKNSAGFHAPCTMYRCAIAQWGPLPCPRPLCRLGLGKCTGQSRSAVTCYRAAKFRQQDVCNGCLLVPLVGTT